jgi:hypothetical protein
MIHRPTCGVITHWRALDPDYQRMGINLRLFDPALLEQLPRKLVDGEVGKAGIRPTKT